MNKKYLCRVWDKETKQMFYPDKWLNFIVGEGKDSVVFSLADAIQEQNRFVIMRYIGRDRKDNDIWEKDIVRKDALFEDDYKEIYLDTTYLGVAYLTSASGAVIRQLKVWRTNNPYEEKLLQDMDNTPAQTKLVFARTIIEGNIYQNKDILENAPKNYNDYTTKK
jgi:hypothetical protein